MPSCWNCGAFIQTGAFCSTDCRRSYRDDDDLRGQPSTPDRVIVECTNDDHERPGRTCGHKYEHPTKDACPRCGARQRRFVRLVDDDQQALTTGGDAR